MNLKKITIFFNLILDSDGTRKQVKIRGNKRPNSLVAKQ